MIDTRSNDAGTAPHRLLLIELAAVDRFHRAITYPYLAGFARACGVPVRWLRVGVTAARQVERDETGVGVEPDEAAAIAAVIRAFEPTRIVLDKQPSASFVQTLREAGGDVQIGLLGPVDSGASGLPLLPSHPAEWAAWLQAETELQALDRFFDVPPHFGYEPVNEAAATMQPLPFVLLGEECTYNRPLARNPRYQGVDLSRCKRDGGCSFCSTGGRGRQRPFSYERALAQLRAIASTLPRPRGRLAIRLQGELALRHADELARACVEVGLTGADLLLDARSDTLVKNRSVLERACGLAREAGLAIHIALIGVESFSRGELELFNKGVSPQDNLDAIVTLLELERDHHGVFRFREHGGISLILFDPWTTLDDLALNLRVLQAAGLEPLSGKVLAGRLRLELGLPITELARAEGLLVARNDDAALETARRNLYGEELPWRFADPRVEPVCRALLRIGEQGEPDPDDPASVRARALVETARGKGMTPLDLGVALVDHAIFEAMEAGAKPERSEASSRASGGASGEVETLLADVERSFFGGRESRFAEEEPVYEAPAAATRLLAALVAEKLKPVAKVELLSPEVARRSVEQYELPNARLRPANRDGSLVELYFGGEAEDVELAVEMMTVAVEAPTTELYEEALLRTGLLLGYPECCVKKFVVEETSKMRESYAWLHLSRRLATPGRVDPHISPWSGLLSDLYVPCSLDCRATLELLPRVHAVAGRLQAECNQRMNEAKMRNPWLVLLRGQCSAMEMVPLDEPGERFRFEPGKIQWGGGEAELLAARKADEIVIEPERLVLYRRGRELVDLGGRAYVWWHERAMQEAFLSRVVAIRDLTARGAQHDGRGAEDGQGGDFAAGEPRVDIDPDSREVDALTPPPELDALRRDLESALAGAIGRRAAWKVWVRSRKNLALRVGSGPGAALLYVTEARPGEKSFFSAGRFAFTIPKSRPLDSAESTGLVEMMRARLR